MPSLRFSLVLLCLSLLCVSVESQQPTYLYHICDNSSNVTDNSQFRANLNVLFSSTPPYLTLNNTTDNQQFVRFNHVLHSASLTATTNYSLHNVTPDLVLDNGFLYASTGQNPTEKANLQFLCRGDFSPDICRDCVDFAAIDLNTRCPIQKAGIIWFDQCLVRFSIEPFLFTMATSPAVYMWNLKNVTQPDSFNAILGAAMNDAATQAARSLNRFATARQNFTVFQTLYSLAQCTPDISSLGCENCLRNVISQLPTCCNGKQGGRVLSPSCNIRYELYPFYKETATQEPPPPPPPPADRSKSRV